MTSGVYERTPEIRAKISTAMRRRFQDPVEREKMSASKKGTNKNNQNHTTHGHTRRVGGRKTSPTYNSWQGMRQRCTNNNARAYRNYGGRGIKVCERWLNSFSNFLEDMGKRPEGRTLGRIDNDGDYEPSNCRWESTAQQGRNSRHCETCRCQLPRRL